MYQDSACLLFQILLALGQKQTTGHHTKMLTNKTITRALFLVGWVTSGKRNALKEALKNCCCQSIWELLSGHFKTNILQRERLFTKGNIQESCQSTQERSFHQKPPEDLRLYSLSMLNVIAQDSTVRKRKVNKYSSLWTSQIAWIRCPCTFLSCTYFEFCIRV